MSGKKIVVVGAGAIGLSSALFLLERGHDVTLIDGDSDDWDNHGAAASLAAAGMLAPEAETAAMPTEGHKRAPELFCAGLEAWRALKSPHARFDGGLMLGQTRGEKLSTAEIETRFGLRTACNEGAYVVDEGVVAPVAQLRAWLEAFRAKGGKAHFNIEADAIERKAWGKAVRCLGGEMFTADEIVLAPGAWASDQVMELAPALKLVSPAKGHLSVVHLKHPLSVNVHGPDFYLASRGGGEAVLGSTMEFGVANRRIDRDRIAVLRANAEKLLPGALIDEPGRAWAGVRPMSPDWAPMIGRSGSESAIVACGHSRNGWLLAPLTARIVAAYVEEREIEPLWAAFSPDRFDGATKS
jgi:glycine oxidase